LAVSSGNQLEQVADQAQVGDLEDRRVLVLVDRDDDLGVLHAGEMLDRARKCRPRHRLRAHDLAGLADLIVVGRIARVDRGAAGADAGAELVGERIDQLVELLREPSARPPETMILAEVSSGRSDAAISAPTKLDSPARRRSRRLDRARPAVVAALAKAVPRTVRTFLASDDCTVAIALPA
jgi:hypothetical protein